MEEVAEVVAEEEVVAGAALDQQQVAPSSEAVRQQLLALLPVPLWAWAWALALVLVLVQARGSVQYSTLQEP